MRSASNKAWGLQSVKLTVVVSVVLLAIAAKPAPKQSLGTVRERYLSPIEMTLSSDGRLIYVVCEGSDELRIVDATSGKAVGSIPVGHVPRGIASSPDGRTLYITNSWSDNVSVIDTAQKQVVQTLSTGFEPTGVVVDRSGATLYVANRLSSDISVIDLETGQEIRRLLAGRGASYLAISPDGKSIYSTHIYPNPGPFRTPPNSEITVIDAQRQMVVGRTQLHNVAGLFHIATSLDGKLGVVAQLRRKISSRSRTSNTAGCSAIR